MAFSEVQTMLHSLTLAADNLNTNIKRFPKVYALKITFWTLWHYQGLQRIKQVEAARNLAEYAACIDTKKYPRPFERHSHWIRL